MEVPDTVPREWIYAYGTLPPAEHVSHLNPSPMETTIRRVASRVGRLVHLALVPFPDDAPAFMSTHVREDRIKMDAKMDLLSR